MPKLAPKAAWVGVCMLAMKDGVVPASSAPGGIYEREFGPWRVMLNGTGEEKPKTDKHPYIEPFGIYVEFNGWPAGIIGPGGGIIAAGDAANEDAFIAAIEVELGSSIDDALNRKD